MRTSADGIGRHGASDDVNGGASGRDTCCRWNGGAVGGGGKMGGGSGRGGVRVATSSSTYSLILALLLQVGSHDGVGTLDEPSERSNDGGY